MNLISLWPQATLKFGINNFKVNKVVLIINSYMNLFFAVPLNISVCISELSLLLCTVA